MEKTSENKKIKSYFWKNHITGVLLILIISMPMVTTILTSFINNPFKNFTSSNDWIGFFGSYLGAIIGGLITLIVMYKTIENGDENLETTITQNKKIQNENNKIAFCNDIAIIVAEFCGSTRVLSEDLRTLNQLFEKYTFWQNEYTNSKSAFTTYKNSGYLRQIVFDDLANQVESSERELQSSKKQYFDAMNRISKHNSITNLFLLEIKLKNIEDAEMLMTKVRNLNKNIEKYIKPRDNSKDLVKDIQDLDLSIKDILEEASQFINKYSNMK